MPYLAAHIMIGLLLTLLVIKGNSPWSPEQRWAGAALLWEIGRASCRERV